MPTQTTIPSKTFNPNKMEKEKHSTIKTNLSSRPSSDFCRPTSLCLQRALEGKLQFEDVNHNQENIRNE